MPTPRRVAPSPSRSARRLLLSASVAALLTAGIPSAAQAAEVLIGSLGSYSVPVFGNCVGEPTKLDTTQSSNNKLTINGGRTTDSAFGAYADQFLHAGQESSQNTLTIKNGGSAGNAYGGQSYGYATHNTVTVTDSSVGSGGASSADLIGGYSVSGDATHNSVSISGSAPSNVSPSSTAITATVIGGYSGSGAATDNSVTVSGGSFSQKVYGAFASAGTATNNRVEISGGSFDADIYGGQAWNDATDNSVTISGGDSFDADIYGGYSSSGTALYNSVTINNTAIGNNLLRTALLYGGMSDSGNAVGNSVKIDGAASDIDRIVYGGYSDDGNAVRNSVTIGDGSFSSPVYGGYSYDGVATGNNLTISGGSFGNAIHGGSSNSGAASDNKVTISGGSIRGSIIGAFGRSATNNTVNILGGTLGTVGGTYPVLLGGQANGSGDAFTGNALNLHVSGQTVSILSNFEHLNFYLPTTVADDDIVLNVKNTAYLYGDNGNSSVVNVGIDGGSSPLAVGDKITLIHAGTLETNDDLNDTADGTGMQGVTLEYAFDIAADGNDLTATVTSGGTTESSKALSEGGAVQASVVNQGSDLSSGSGTANAIGAARSNTSSFSAMSGGSVRTETGSHVDVKGVSLLAGLSGTFELLDSMVVAAPYFEYGYGAYDTYNTFASGSVHGTGNSSYVGAGVLAHMDFLETDTGHAYVEGGARAGVAYNSFNSADLVSGGVSAQYDASSAYYGLNAGLGYVWTLTEESSLDIYGQYSWNELGSDSVTLSTGDIVDFAAVDSHRVRLGARYSYEMSEQATPYVDLAWEHEFDGSVSATTNGYAIAEPSLSGDTGIFSAGLKLTPSEDLPLTLDFNVTGYVGRNQGISGGLQAKVAF